MLEHGGTIRRVAEQFDIPLEQWLDLSTGINPLGWTPVPVPQTCWTRLPEENDGLELAARAYYQTSHLLPVSGSQTAIQSLPHLHAPTAVAILSPTYNEHAHAWKSAGCAVTEMALAGLESSLESFSIVVVVNPNNPTGILISPERLLSWHERLQPHHGWLVVDEAFMDATPTSSLASHAGTPGLIILRSLGKFFGLAGARVGFVLGESGLLHRLHRHLGPWHLGGSARWVARQALADTAWQENSRLHLPLASQRLATLLTQSGLPPTGGTPLFQWVTLKNARHLWLALAKKGILIRLFSEPESLRFGLPGEEAEWVRLQTALQDYCQE